MDCVPIIQRYIHSIVHTRFSCRSCTGEKVTEKEKNENQRKKEKHVSNILFHLVRETWDAVAFLRRRAQIYFRRIIAGQNLGYEFLVCLAFQMLQ